MQTSIIFFLLFLFCGEINLSAKEPKICLNMIVKDESHVIRRCLESVKPIIDYWVIVDTGSTDGTQAIIQEFMADIPGELHERPWHNFSHNRNEALNLAKGKAEYLLIIDADDILTYAENFSLPKLTDDFFFITVKHGEMLHKRTHLISTKVDWKWVGVIHEGLESKRARRSSVLEGITYVVNTDGFRSQDPQKFFKDAKVLEEALLLEPNNVRYVFYLAQTYRDAGESLLAIQNYGKRISMGGWDQEIFWSMLQIARLKEHLNEDEETIVEAYERAYQYRPTRIEPLYQLAKFHRTQGNYQEGYNVALQGLITPHTTDILFVEEWMYDYGLMLELSICAYWDERYVEAFLASQELLAKPRLPTHVRECVQNNMVWIDSKISKEHWSPSKKAPQTLRALLNY